MNFKVSRKTLVRILSWTAIVLLAPFAIEVAIMADIVGAEAALAFLFLYGKAVTAMLRERITLSRNLIRAAYRSSPNTEFYPQKVYLLGSVASIVLFWVTGSFLLSFAAWIPSVILLGQQI